MAAHDDFRKAIESRDIEGAIGLLSPEVVFRSPAVHTPYEGREATGAVLRAVSEVFEDFRYMEEVGDGNLVALIFEARVGDKELQGLDLVRIEDDRITELTVMIRPFSGLQATLEAVGRKLAVQTSGLPDRSE